MDENIQIMNYIKNLNYKRLVLDEEKGGKDQAIIWEEKN